MQWIFDIRAELYKLNIYSAPTGYFRAYAYSGSLPALILMHFLGGALIARHNGQVITFDWSSPDD